MNYSTLLGSFELSPLELASIYTAFINDGVSITQPKLLLEHDNKPLLTEQENISLFSPQATYIMRHLLKEASIKYGFDKNKSHGGKTGTTNEKQDLWFAGYNQDLVSVVWMGFDKPAPLYEYAAKNSAVIWERALKGIKRDYEERVPDNIMFKIDSNNTELPFIKESSTS